MLTNQVIQKTIQDIKRVSGYEISLWGADGESMASSASESETLKDKVKSFIEDSEMEEILRENKNDLEQAGRTLVERANEAGGKDNISVILVRL